MDAAGGRPDLTPADQEQFIEQGFLRVDAAFSPETAAEGRAILWRDTGCDPHHPSTWTRPVVRLGAYSDPPFQRALESPLLKAAFDQLIGPDRWLPCDGLGTFPIRFPSSDDPGDTGWHVDASFPPHPGGDGSFFSWRINVRSKGRALLMLFLFSDVGPNDAPTRIRVGSHFDVARILAPAGDDGLSCLELSARLEETSDRPEALATGPAGTVYLCHPFLVHAAQSHRGSEPRFMAQPPLGLPEPLCLDREHGAVFPLEQAIRNALRK